MNPDKLRVKIAEACPNVFWIYQNPAESAVSLRPARKRVFRLGEHPEYGDKELDPLNDLNACHEMEKVLTLEQQGQYTRHLMAICGTTGVWHEGSTTTLNWFWHATALQRCEAFARTLGFYEECS